MNRARRHICVLIATAALIVSTPLMVRAEASADFQRIISAQIEAFARDDGTAAFTYASPGIRSKFQTPDRFMQMVRSGYAPVYRPKSVTFGRVSTEFGGRPTQHVVFVDQSGRVWTALYAFERQPDGGWKIDGVAFTETDEIVS